MPEQTLRDPRTFTSGAAAAAAYQAVMAEREAIHHELNTVNQGLHHKNITDAVHDITTKWAARKVDGQTRGARVTPSGRTADAAVARYLALGDYADHFEQNLPPAILSAYHGATPAMDGSNPMAEASTMVGTGDALAGPVVSEDQAAALSRLILRMGNSGAYENVVSNLSQIENAAGRPGTRVNAGTNPRLTAWLNDPERKGTPHGTVGALDDAAARRLSGAWNRSVTAPPSLNIEDLGNRLYAMDQDQLNALSDTLFAAGYIQPSDPSSFDWTRPYAGQSLVTAATLMAPMTTWWSETAAAKGRTMSDILDQRTKSYANELDRMKVKATAERQESLTYLSMAADQVVQAQLGRSLGGAWNQRTVSTLVDRVARGGRLSDADVEAQVRMALQEDPELHGQQQSFSMLHNVNALSNFLSQQH